MRRDQGNPAGAVEPLERALAVLDRSAKRDTSALVEALGGLAMAQHEMHRPTWAEPYARRLVGLFEGGAGGNLRALARARALLGTICFQVGKRAEAEDGRDE